MLLQEAELVKKMLLQEVRQSDSRTDGNENMLIHNGYKSQPALDDFQNESAVTRMKAIKFARWNKLTWRYKHVWRAWKRSENQEDDKKGLEYQISLMKKYYWESGVLLTICCTQVETWLPPKNQCRSLMTCSSYWCHCIGNMVPW